MNATDPSLGAALRLAGMTSSAESAIGSALARVGLSLDDFRRLRLLAEHSAGLSREELAEAMAETRSQTVRAASPLVKLGWLTRAEEKTFVLADSGRAVIDQAEGIAEKAAERWFADLGLDPVRVTAALTP
ncbi:MAG: hypothetical protein ACTIC1_18660 [Brevibacterium sp.]